MQTITRELWFSAGHRVYGHEGHCSNIHGHNYTVFITAKKDESNLDKIGRVIDFRVLKEKIDPWLQSKWDHACLWYETDPVGRYMYGDLSNQSSPVGRSIYEMKNFKCPFNPTAEEMAEYLLTQVCPKLMKGTGVTVIQVRLYETARCMATSDITVPAVETIPNPMVPAENAL